MSDSTTPPFQVSGFMGPYLLEMCFVLVLYGVATAQAYVYSLNCKNDSTTLKIIVATVWILETLHSVFLLRQVWFCAIMGFGDYVAIGSIEWSIIAVIFAENGIIALVQGFYIRRIWLLNGRRVILPGMLLFVLATRLGLHTTVAAFAAISELWMTFAQHVAATICLKVSNVTAAALDGTIALCVIYFLGRDQSQYKRTNGMLRWLMLYTVNTGALSMVASICVAITYSYLPNTLTFAGVAAIVSKLYSNSFLGALNAREMMRDKVQSQPVLLDSSGIKTPRQGEYQTGSIEKGHLFFPHSNAHSDSSETYVDTNSNHGVEVIDPGNVGVEMV